MNTKQLSKVLTQDPLTREAFRGVFASDQLNFIENKYPFLLVVNSDPSTQSGTHWMAMYFPSEREGEFYDSYGNDAKFYNKDFERFMKRHSKRNIFNTIPIQSNSSNVCGHHCLFYLIHRVRQVDMESIIKFFSPDKDWNDIMVNDFIYKHFNFDDHPFPSYKGKCLVEQWSRPRYEYETFV